MQLFLTQEDLVQWQSETWFPYASQNAKNAFAKVRVKLDVNTFGTFRVSTTQGSAYKVEYEGKNRQTAVDTFNEVSGF